MNKDKRSLILLFTGCGSALLALPFALYGAINFKPLSVVIADTIMFVAFVQLVFASKK